VSPTPVVLEHCEPVTVYQSGTAGPVDVAVTVGGGAADGTVHVVANQGADPPSHEVPTDSSRLCSFTDCTSVSLHYVKSGSGPDSVSGTYDVL
jgi:hypothetical protein